MGAVGEGGGVAGSRRRRGKERQRLGVGVDGRGAMVVAGVGRRG